MKPHTTLVPSRNRLQPSASTRLFILILLVMLFPFKSVGQDISVTLGWTQPEVLAGEPVITGYQVHYGTQPRSDADYTSCLSAGTETELTVPNLLHGQIYYFAVTASNEIGMVSSYSAEIAWANGDSDLDSMQDAWEENTFGADAATIFGDEDSDQDGVNNAAEFAAGTDPLDPESKPSIYISRQNGIPSVGFTAPQMSGIGYENMHRRVVLEQCAAMGEEWEPVVEVVSLPDQDQHFEYDPAQTSSTLDGIGYFRIRTILAATEMPERPTAEALAL